PNAIMPVSTARHAASAYGARVAVKRVWIAVARAAGHTASKPAPASRHGGAWSGELRAAIKKIAAPAAATVAPIAIELLRRRRGGASASNSASGAGNRFAGAAARPR